MEGELKRSFEKGMVNFFVPKGTEYGMRSVGDKTYFEAKRGGETVRIFIGKYCTFGVIETDDEENMWQWVHAENGEVDCGAF